MTPEKLGRMTKAELLKLAAKKKIKVTSTMLKADLVKAIAGPGVKTKAKTGTGSKAKAKAKIKAKSKTGTKAKAKTKKVGKSAQSKAVAAVKPKKKRSGRTAARKPAKKPSAIDNDRTIRQKAVASKYHLITGPRALPPVESMAIPEGYGITRIVAMVRDPYWMHAYWEITGEKFSELEKKFGDQWTSCRLALRVYDRTRKPAVFFDVDPGYGSRSWYLNVSPGRKYQVAVGVIDPQGRFTEIAVSQITETPSDQVSDVVDDKWLVPDEVYNEIFAASGGHESQARSSAEAGKEARAFLMGEIGSEAVSSFSSAEMQKFRRQRGFRLWVATELILYGATEPDARVTIQGKEIKLRGDGTFSARFALPDGTIDIPVTALSGDGIEERCIETSVAKKSEEKEPVTR